MQSVSNISVNTLQPAQAAFASAVDFSLADIQALDVEEAGVGDAVAFFGPRAESVLKKIWNARPTGANFGFSLSLPGSNSLGIYDTFQFNDEGMTRSGTAISLNEGGRLLGQALGQGVRGWTNEEWNAMSVGRGVSFPLTPEFSVGVNMRAGVEEGLPIVSVTFIVSAKPARIAARMVQMSRLLNGGIAGSVAEGVHSFPIQPYMALTYSAKIFYDREGNVQEIRMRGEKIAGSEGLRLPDIPAIRQLQAEIQSEADRFQEGMEEIESMFYGWMIENGADPVQFATEVFKYEDSNIPVIDFAKRKREVFQDLAAPYFSQLSPELQGMVAVGGPSTTAEFGVAMRELRYVLSDNHYDLLLRRMANSHGVDFNDPYLREANREFEAKAYSETVNSDINRAYNRQHVPLAEILQLGNPGALGPQIEVFLAGLGLDGILAGTELDADGNDLAVAGELDSIDDLDPEMQAAWELMQGVVVETMGNVADALNTPPRSFDPIAQQVDDAMAFVGPLLPQVARDVIKTATATARVADGNSTFDQKAALAIAALNALPLGDTIDTALDYGALALQMKQFFSNPSVGGGVSLASNLIGRGVGPKTAATIAAVANAVELALAPTPPNFARFAWSVVNLTQMYDQVRIDMGETSVAAGAMADVTFMGTTNSVGPQYKYVLSGDQPNLPALNRAIFDLIERHDGSFAFSGKGFRDPFSIDSDVSGEMTTPGVIAGLDGVLWLKRGPDSMHDGFQIDGDLARLLMQHNGGNTRFDVNAGWSAFAEIEALFGRFGLDTTYLLPAKEGMLSEFDLGDPLAVRTFPHGIPGVQGYDDRIVAAFRQPGMMDHRFTFRDLESAAIFQVNGLDIVSEIASHPHLINAFGSRRDIQGMIDYIIGNPDRPATDDLFNAFSYLAANPDLRQHFDERDVMGYALHYLTAGHSEGRPRHADLAATNREIERFLAFTVFDEDVYRALYPDVAAAIRGGGFADAREHFRHHGLSEGRMPAFNAQAYLDANPDVAAHVAAGGGTALDHYVQFGQHEGRILAPPTFDAGAIQHGETHAAGGFDERAYLAANADVAAAIANGTMDSARGHWERHGQGEGRAFFDEQAYLAQHQGVAEAVANGTMDSGLGHWERHGQHEGFGIAVSQNAPIAPVADHHQQEVQHQAPAFNEQTYLQNNPDVAEAVANGGNAYEHYVNYGEAEGRTW